MKRAAFSHFKDNNYVMSRQMVKLITSKTL